MEQRKGPKRSKLKPSVKRLIFQEAIRQRDIPRELLANRLIKEVEEWQERPPTLEVAIRYISKARNATKPIDKPWSLGACRDYPTFFPPASLPTLIKMQEEQKKFVDVVTDVMSPGLSIRTCMWIARLQAYIHADWMHGEDDPQAEHNILFSVASAYATAERTSETMEEQAFDTNDLDQALCSRDVAKVILFGSADKDTTFLCNGNCDSCNYFPIVPGKLCQLRGLKREDEIVPEHYLIRPTKKGE